jgi:lipoate-protein ligase A
MPDPSKNLLVSNSFGGDPAADLARESRLLRIAATGQPCLTFCSWPKPVVVLGYAQPEDDADLEFCRSRSIPVLRRISGGTGVLHNRDFSLALAVPVDHPWSRGVREGYSRFLDVLEPVLRDLGTEIERIENPVQSSRGRSPICFEDQLAETLLINGRKVVGCAQARRAGAVVIHATILRHLDADLYGKIFKVDRQRISRNLAPLGVDIPDIELVQALAQGFASRLDLALEETEPPDPQAKDLEPYSSPRWAPVYDIRSK